MNVISLITLPAEHLRVLADRTGPSGGGSAAERSLALAVALVTMAAAMAMALAA
jgi:formiminotetrahydrofolate cyclodeaminase